MLSTGILLRWLRYARRGRGNARRRQRSERELVRNSALFDAGWYLQRYLDVAKAGSDPLADFMASGWREGRDPGPNFSTTAYLNANTDVAESGINPLVHFIEFGEAEGRPGGGRHHSNAEHVVSASFDFAPSAVVLSYPLPDAPSLDWVRHHDLDSRHPAFFATDELSIGYVEDARKGDFQRALDVLACLSGFIDETKLLPVTTPPGSAEFLVDAWYANIALLRTRWSSERLPLIVRAFQADEHNGKLRLVGERLVSSDLDIVDLDLPNALFPILFTFSEPDGHLRGTQLLSFPSLCRGGHHYPELLCAQSKARRDRANAVAVGCHYADRLLQSFQGGSKHSLSVIKAPTGGRVFGSDIQSWLSRVMRISPVEMENENRGSDQSRARGPGGVTLKLNSQSIPTIDALTEIHDRGINRSDGEDYGSIIVHREDASLPSFRIQPPAGLPAALKSLCIGDEHWPREKAFGDRHIPEAILRAGTKKLSEEELIVPTSHWPASDSDSEERRGGISWLIEAPSGRDRRAFAETLNSLALQDGAEADFIVFLGPADRETLSMAADRFRDRVNVFDGIQTAAAESRTPFVGFIGPGVILHDTGSARHFAKLLLDETVATASSVFVQVKRRGRTWHASLASTKRLFSLAGPPLPRSELVQVIEHLWRSTIFVGQPSGELWVARASRVGSWVKGIPDDGFHACSTSVTASIQDSVVVGQGTSFMPPSAPAERTTRIEALFG